MVVNFADTIGGGVIDTIFFVIALHVRESFFFRPPNMLKDSQLFIKKECGNEFEYFVSRQRSESGASGRLLSIRYARDETLSPKYLSIPKIPILELPLIPQTVRQCTYAVPVLLVLSISSDV